MNFFKKKSTWLINLKYEKVKYNSTLLLYNTWYKIVKNSGALSLGENSNPWLGKYKENNLKPINKNI